MGDRLGGGGGDGPYLTQHFDRFDLPVFGMPRGRLFDKPILPNDPPSLIKVFSVYALEKVLVLKKREDLRLVFSVLYSDRFRKITQAEGTRQKFQNVAQTNISHGCTRLARRYSLT